MARGGRRRGFSCRGAGLGARLEVSWQNLALGLGRKGAVEWGQAWCMTGQRRTGGRGGRLEGQDMPQLLCTHEPVWLPPRTATSPYPAPADKHQKHKRGRSTLEVLSGCAAVTFCPPACLEVQSSLEAVTKLGTCPLLTALGSWGLLWPL